MPFSLIRHKDRITARHAAVVAIAFMGIGVVVAQNDEVELVIDGILPAMDAGMVASSDRVLTSVADVFKVPRDTDNLAFPVEIDGVVISTAYETASFFLHDGRMGIHVSQPGGPRFRPGDRVRVIGNSRRGRYAPSIIPRKIVLLGEGGYPEPRPVSFSQVASGSMDSQWVEIDGVVCAITYTTDRKYVLLDLTQDGARLRAIVGNPLPERPEQLLDCEVRMRGVASGRFNKHGQMIEPALRVPGATWVTIIQRGPADPFTLPTRTVSRLLEFSIDRQPRHRIKVQGEVTRCFSDTTLFIRDEGHGLKVETLGSVKLQAGDRIEAVGFPVIANDEVVIQNAVTRLMGPSQPPAPVRSKLPALLNGSRASDLVAIKARLVDWVADGPSITLILEAGNRLFRGLLQRPAGSTWVVPENGSIVDVTGICVIDELEDRWNYQPRSFLLLLAAPEDLKVLESPPWWTAERLWRAFLISLSLLAAGSGWVWALRRQVQRKRSVIEFQASHAAVLEERSRIARDLHDTLEQGLTGVSLQMKAVDTDLNANPQQAHARLQSAREMLRQCRAIARNAISELRVEVVPRRHESLAEALCAVADLWKSSGAFTAKLHVTGDPVQLPGDIEHHLIGIGTEAMTNAVKHGRATSVGIDIGYGEGLVTLRITDNGNGFDPVAIRCDKQGCYGLMGMRERAHEMGARIDIQSQHGQGTTILVSVPLKPSPTGSPVVGAGPSVPTPTVPLRFTGSS